MAKSKRRRGGGKIRGSKAKKRTITNDVEADPSPESLRQWVDVQVPYQNYAGLDELRDNRAVGYVTEIVKTFQSTHVSTFRKWELIRRLMDSMRGGTGEGESPEIYKAVERMIPRIEDQVIGYDEWFKVHGRTRQDQRQSSLIGAFIAYQLDAIQFRKKINPAIRTMLGYGFAPFKTWWETKSERRVVRKSVRSQIDGHDRVTTVLEEKDVVTFNGPRTAMVDPFDFIIDTDATEPEDARFVGDIYKMTYQEMLALQEQGIFNNVEELEEATPLGRADYNGWYKAVRNRSSSETDYRNKKIDGLPQEFFLSEIWGLFDINNDGHEVQCVITVANWSVPVRIQENPYDDKHIPYAICRANREAFDFFAIAPLDNCIRPQLQMNKHRSLAMRSHENSLVPIILASDTQDLPRSLWEVEPGSILEIDDPGAVKELKTSSTLPEMMLSDQIHSSDIEEVSGSTKMLSGTEDSGTATESMNKMQESSRRIRSYVHNFTLGINDVLKQFHSLNTQYVMGPQKFRILGKPAKGLNAYEEIDQEVLQTEIDFTFTALASLHSGDLRANLILQYLNLSAPIAAKYPGQVNELQLLDQLGRDMLGGVLDMSDVISIPTPPDQLMSQNEENMMLAQGQKVEVDSQDDDEEHLDSMDSLMERLDDFNGSTQAMIIEHYHAHLAAVDSKAAQKRQQMTGGPPPAFQPPAEEFDTSRGTTGQQKQPGDEPGSMYSQGVGQGPMGQERGVASGPPNPHSMSAPDRTTALFGSQQAG